MRIFNLDIFVTQYFYEFPQPTRCGIVTLDSAWEIYFFNLYIIISKI